jgi:hypothetical protein
MPRVNSSNFATAAFHGKWYLNRVKTGPVIREQNKSEISLSPKAFEI